MTSTKQTKFSPRLIFSYGSLSRSKVTTGYRYKPGQTLLNLVSLSANGSLQKQGKYELFHTLVLMLAAHGALCLSAYRNIMCSDTLLCIGE